MSSKTAAKPPVKKIDSPLAKYNSTGQLFCVLCNSHIKNEIYWTGHVNGKSHREQLSILKSKNKRSHEQANPPSPSPTKKVKFEDSDFTAPLPPPPMKTNSPVSVKSSSDQPQNLRPFASSHSKVEFDLAAFDEEMKREEENSSKPEPKTPVIHSTPQLPEGFFDDPKEDAKARGIEYRNPEEVEWEKFVKEIASEEIKSTALRSVDEEESTFSRDLDEIEEQMAHWQKVIDLEKKAQLSRQQMLTRNDETNSKMEEDDDEEIDYDEDLDWRSKKH